MPSGRAFSWLPIIPTSIAPVAENVLVQPVPGTCGLPSILITTLPAGGFIGEGLLPVPEKICRKIVLWRRGTRCQNPGLGTMRKQHKKVLPLPWRESAPLTNLMLWVQCFAGVVGVFSTQYPQMMPDLMAYLTTIEYSRDFEGVSRAQYHRAYRWQMAQTKDLRWPRLNPTLFSLCFTGKARRSVMYSHCLSDQHVSDSCTDWGRFPNATAVSSGAPGPAMEVVKANKDLIFNKKDAYSYNPCKFAHIQGEHPQSVQLVGVLRGSRRLEEQEKSFLVEVELNYLRTEKLCIIVYVRTSIMGNIRCIDGTAFTIKDAVVCISIVMTAIQLMQKKT